MKIYSHGAKIAQGLQSKTSGGGEVLFIWDVLYQGLSEEVPIIQCC